MPTAAPELCEGVFVPTAAPELREAVFVPTPAPELRESVFVPTAAPELCESEAVVSKAGPKHSTRHPGPCPPGSVNKPQPQGLQDRLVLAHRAQFVHRVLQMQHSRALADA